MASLDPYLVLGRLRRRSLPLPRVTVLGVYSEEHAPVMRAVVDQANRVGWPVRLWSVDTPSPLLTEWTVGSGPGTRGANYNRLAEGVPSDHHLVLCDDDVALRDKGLASWIAISSRLAFDISQPGHGRGSYAAHPITRRSRRLLARRTTFVEMGPLVCFSPGIRPHVMPQDEVGYGWGTELRWLDLAEHGARLGIVDAVPMWHLRAPGQGYARAEEDAKQEQLLSERGLSGWDEVQRVIERIRWT